MNDEVAFFIIAMTALVAGAVLILSLIRGRHRIAELRAGTAHSPQSAREIELLSSENAGLKRKVGRLEERLSVLERIATDPAERTAREIEQLRSVGNEGERA
jgi:cell division protein FtsB